MKFKLNRTGSVLDRNERNKLNENWNMLEEVIVSQGENIISDVMFDSWLKDNKLQPKPSVDSISELPNSGSLGDIRGVKSDNSVYVYDGTMWQRIGAFNFSELDEVQSDITKLKKDFTYNPNSTPPSKIGVQTNSRKLVRKIKDKTLEVYQKTTNGYLRYTFSKDIGGSGYGVNYELLRLIKVEPISDVVLFQSVDSPVEGSVTKTFPTISNEYANSTILEYIESHKRDTNNLTHNNKPLTPYTIDIGSSVTYKVQKNIGENINLMFFHRSAGSGNLDNVNIYVNGNKTRAIEVSRSFFQSTKVFEIEMPYRQSFDTPFDLKIENVSENEIYLVAINIYKLKEHNGNGFNSFLAVGSTSPNFIDHKGASDYAFKNQETGLQFGSYHGGEKSVECKVTSLSEPPSNSEVFKDFNSISSGSMYSVENFQIKQLTNLIDRVDMKSYMSLNVDGTIKMDFAYSVKPDATPIPLQDCWTELTCITPHFSKLTHPIQKNNAGETGHFYFKTTHGLTIQETADGNSEVHIRYSRFNNEFLGTEEADSISRAEPAYHKHYYTPIREYKDKNNPIAPTVMQFSKSVDFYVW